MANRSHIANKKKGTTTMYENVLLASDASDQSKAAAREVNRLIKFGLVKKLTILNVGNTFLQNLDNTIVNIAQVNEAVQDLGQKLVSATREIITEDIEIVEKVLLGDPPQIICEEAEKLGSDLIVMGSRGRNPISGLLLGSVSTRVLQCASCPVLVVKK